MKSAHGSSLHSHFGQVPRPDKPGPSRPSAPDLDAVCHAGQAPQPAEELDFRVVYALTLPLFVVAVLFKRAVGGTLMRLGRRPQSVLAEARSDAHTYLPLAFVK
ncbi:MAG: hypothetical protein KDK91_23460 [Gammaproteobacteria bacterium]|nr:hypothetical protein [Gammaproteobacteria bacterium]